MILAQSEKADIHNRKTFWVVQRETIERANIIHRLSCTGLERGQYIVTIQTETQGTMGRKLLVTPE